MGTRPKILLVALETFVSARLPKALQAAGFSVAVACRPDCHLAQTRFCDERFMLTAKNHGRGLLAGIRGVVQAWRPDWVVPLDDWTALYLARIHEWKMEQGRETPLATLLERSFGQPPALRELASKWRTQQVAKELGLRVPLARRIEAAADAQDFAVEHGFPVVIKRSFSHGGHGVFICRNAGEVSTAWARLSAAENLFHRIAHWREKIRGREMETQWLPFGREIFVSQFIAGQPAMLQALAFEGRLVGALKAVAEKTFPGETGPASVVRFLRHPGMRHAAEKIIQHWGLSGFLGFDFVLDRQGEAWFLECNPRPIPIAHLGAQVGEDLCGQLFAALTGGKPPIVAGVRELVVAHYPKEIWRDPRSPFLQTAFHDVPTDDAALLARLEATLPPSANV